MRFSEELVDTAGLEFPKASGVRKQDLATAKLLVNHLAAKWDPEQYTDDYRANLMKVIEAKRKGEEVEFEAEADPRHHEVVDLMERLRQSLGTAAPGGRRTAKAAPAKRRKAATRKVARARRKSTRKAA